MAAMIDGGKMDADSSGEVTPRKVEETPQDGPGTQALANRDETTVAGWPTALWRSGLGRAAVAAALVALTAWIWVQSRRTDPIETAVTPKPEVTAPRQESRTGPVDPDLKAAAAAKEAQAEARLAEAEEKLKAVEERAKETQQELSQTEKKLKEALKAEREPPLLPPKACPSEMVLIPSGDFLFGSDKGDPDRNDLVEPPATRIPQGKYCVDRYEYPNRKGSVPKTGVNWFEAQTSCNQAGKRLCTQEEWERSCKGPVAKLRNKRFPYGDAWDPSRCNTEKKDSATGEVLDRKLAPSGAFSGCGTTEGIYDMSGNADEWTLSRGRFTGEARVTHGGSSHHAGWASRCSSVREVLQGTRDNDIGFRCCKDAL
jgi:formylglycine-generating enzyme required for sulfatase activity